MQHRPAEIKHCPQLVEVAALDDYKLLATFASGEVREYDCAPLLDSGFFQPLKNKGFFKRAYANLGGVVWSDAVDLAREPICFDGAPVSAIRQDLPQS